MTDGQGRSIDYLRISITDRCNLRCVYCMPAEGVEWVPHASILSYEEIVRLTRLFASLGVRRIRLTGGEPLVRRGLDDLIRELKAIPGIETVMVTTNGTLLREQLPGLMSAGLDGVNISLDTLDPVQFAAIARRSGLSSALAGLNAALDTPGLTVKLNCVPTLENASQWVPLAELARNRPLAVRFIELMPIGLGGGMPGISEADLRAWLEEALGPLAPCEGDKGGGPCRYFRPAGFRGKIGFISAMTHQFCSTCNRVRLTATGFLKTCLQYDAGVELRPLLSSGTDDAELLRVMEGAILNKPLPHHFGASSQSRDERRTMNQIGG